MTNKVTGPSNVQKRMLARKLWQTKRRIWRDVSKRLMAPQKNRVEVNLAKLNLATSKDDVVVIPGKVLSVGNMTKAITVACYAISSSAAKKLEESGSKRISIEDLLKQNPSGSGVKIIV
ncbi:50S ribosomal protein L18e [Candidatus Lokiarchaeum ossiferum]|uniref:50S ribosomal protein L18e n=1 Tax=Candidatus Lokiarchaeum ossiferum TaxID=2951803 RepID=A0ABY6HW51_9ARCH|nr:50S ribosomal protein L18e [Candidatus Lokiarchaeum sp. B-35]